MTAIPRQYTVATAIEHFLATGRKQLHRAAAIGTERKAVAYAGLQLEPVYTIVYWGGNILGGTTLEGVGIYGVYHILVNILYRLLRITLLAVPKAEQDIVFGIYHRTRLAGRELETRGTDWQRVYGQQCKQTERVNQGSQVYHMAGCRVPVEYVFIPCQMVPSEGSLIEKICFPCRYFARGGKHIVGYGVKSNSQRGHIHIELQHSPQRHCDRLFQATVNAIMPSVTVASG